MRRLGPASRDNVIGRFQLRVSQSEVAKTENAKQSTIS